MPRTDGGLYYPALSRANFEKRAQGAILLDSGEADGVFRAVQEQVGVDFGVRLVLSSELQAGIRAETCDGLARPPFKKRTSSAAAAVRSMKPRHAGGKDKTEKEKEQEVKHQTAADPSTAVASAPATEVQELGPELGSIPVENLEVREVVSKLEQDEAIKLHLSKNTFHEERELVKLRVCRGLTCGCRTWVLVAPCRGALGGPANSTGATPPVVPSSIVVATARAQRGSRGNGRAGGAARGRASHSVAGSAASGIGSGAVHDTVGSPVAFLAAATVRMNVYQNYDGVWAQVLNMSTRRERHGLGTHLIAGLEELLRREAVNVAVLYPAENGRAPSFWSSLGFGPREVSLLPPEELVSHEEGGPLLPEFDAGTEKPLPRWEKQLLKTAPMAPATAATAGKKQHQTRRSGQKSPGALSLYRTIPAISSRLGGESLRLASDALCAQRRRWKNGGV